MLIHVFSSFTILRLYVEISAGRFLVHYFDMIFRVIIMNQKAVKFKRDLVSNVMKMCKYQHYSQIFGGISAMQ